MAASAASGFALVQQGCADHVVGADIARAQAQGGLISGNGLVPAAGGAVAGSPGCEAGRRLPGHGRWRIHSV